jgi:hypothetical protein
MIKIQIELEAMQTALDVVSKTAAPASGNITFTAASGKLTITSLADLSRCHIVVPCTVEGDGEFAVPLQAVVDATKNRKTLELINNKSVLTIKSGSYKAELATVDVIALDPLDAEEGQTWKLTPEQAQWLRSGLRNVAMKPTTLLSSWMPVGIKLTEKSAFIVCYDTQRMNWETSKEVTGDLEILMPVETMSSIIEVFHKSSFSIKQGKSHIEIKNKLIKVQMSIPTVDDLPSLAEVQGKIKEASKVSASTFSMSKDSVLSFLDNARAVIGKERTEVLVTSKEKGLELVVTTGQGTVRNSIKGSGKGSFKIDQEYLQELVTKAPAELALNVVESAFISMKLEKSSAIVALNQ